MYNTNRSSTFQMPQRGNDSSKPHTHIYPHCFLRSVRCKCRMIIQIRIKIVIVDWSISDSVLITDKSCYYEDMALRLQRWLTAEVIASRYVNRSQWTSPFQNKVQKQSGKCYCLAVNPIVHDLWFQCNQKIINRCLVPVQKFQCKTSRCLRWIKYPVTT